ncbi:hypothetical protein BGZ89_003569 [Linnemannia elongata]|nr:hypothetical protein BGZ89_003569 [Linnemannia elongata]
MSITMCSVLLEIKDLKHSMQELYVKPEHVKSKRTPRPGSRTITRSSGPDWCYAKTLTRSNTKDKKTALDKDELFHPYMSFTFGMPI